MALLLAKVKWYEWVLIGVLLLGSVGAYLLWNKYDGQRDVLAQANADINVLTDAGDYKDQSATITDQVVTEFVQEQSDVQVQQKQSRTGVIDEYISMAGEPLVRYPDPTPMANETTEKSVPRPTKKIEVTTARPRDDVSAVTTRLNALASGMHKHYCAAAPQRGVTCDTVSPVD